MSKLSESAGGGRDLRELIDSYNSELMDLHRRQSESAAMPRVDASGEKTEVLREASEITDDEQQRRWLLDLEEGLEELRKGLIELAKGQQELCEGMKEWQEGMKHLEVSSGGEEAPSPAPEPQPLPDGQPEREPAQHGGPQEAPKGGAADGSGTLRITVSTARQAVPVENAHIVVTYPTSGGELFYAACSTDSSGQSPAISLPVAGGGENDEEEYAPPYVSYRVRVSAAGYREQDDLVAQMFGGVESTLPVELSPLSEQGGGM